MPEITPESELHRTDGVIPGELPDETVLLSIDSGTALRLNETGAWLWTQLEHTCQVAALAALLADRHRIEPHRAMTDVVGFADALAQRDFIEIR